MSRTLAVDEAGTVVWPWRWVTGVQAAFDRVLFRLSTIRGEYPTDRTLGLALMRPGGGWISDVEIEAQIRRELRRSKYAGPITSLTITNDGDVKTIRLAFDVTANGVSLAQMEIGTVLGSQVIGAWSIIGGGSIR